jgi:hypothetical protein
MPSLDAARRADIAITDGHEKWRKSRKETAQAVNTTVSTAC